MKSLLTPSLKSDAELFPSPERPPVHKLPSSCATVAMMDHSYDEVLEEALVTLRVLVHRLNHAQIELALVKIHTSDERTCKPVGENATAACPAPRIIEREPGFRSRLN